MKNRLPLWFRQEIPDERIFHRLGILSKFGIHTVCQEAKCPNLNDCFKREELTFMILGDICTRNCRFCAVAKCNGQRLKVDWQEPYRIAQAVKELGLDYVVITSVTRDDLEDGGASIFAKTIALVKEIRNDIKVEVLIPDFKGNISSLEGVASAKPDVVAHNIETVKKLYRQIRPQADYKISLEVLKRVKQINPGLTTKSSLMLGLGEKEEEVVEVTRDLRQSYCDILTLGQYLAPSPQHYPVKEFVSLEQFENYQKIGLGLGFKSVLSGPLVRSSYKAGQVYAGI